EEYDSLPDGWNVGGQNVTGAGSTVLEVMTAQFYKGFSSYDAYRNRQTCKGKQLKSCNHCYDCKNFRLNMIQNFHEGCEACMQRIDEKQKAFNNDRRCLNCMDDKAAKKSYVGGLLLTSHNQCFGILRGNVDGRRSNKLRTKKSKNWWDG
ncbi:hypothetical protein BGZ75_000385, partial [Mortierella antarctica]